MNDFDNSSHTHEYGIGTDEAPSTAIAMAVSTAVGQPVEDIPPLQDHLAASALNELCESLPPEADDSSGHVTFSYHGFTVTVSGSDTVYLRK